MRPSRRFGGMMKIDDKLGYYMTIGMMPVLFVILGVVIYFLGVGAHEAAPHP